MHGPFIDFLRFVQDLRLLCNICSEGRLSYRIFRCDASSTSTPQMPNSRMTQYFLSNENSVHGVCHHMFMQSRDSPCYFTNFAKQSLALMMRRLIIVLSM